MTVSINAQEPTVIPTAPATPVVRDDDIRLRSVEMERIKREAAKKDSEAVVVNNEIDKKYPEIKEDFEGMQLSQAAVIKAYTTTDPIDYATIAASAEKINKNAKRLNSNLFISKIKSKKDDKEEKKTETVRSLIVALDNAIGAVATSKMWQNLRVVDPEVAKKTQDDLARVMVISEELSEVAKKMK
jgi:hypothetical protein